MTDPTFFGIDETLINNVDAVEARVNGIDETDRPTVRHALVYLYRQDGPISISREQKSQAEPYLNPVELFVFQWLYKRTDGKLRRHYGQNALRAVRAAKFRCATCGFADVRALHIEPVEATDAEAPKQFTCLCANCQTVNAKVKEIELVETRRAAAAALAAEAVAEAEAAAAAEAVAQAEAEAATARPADELPPTAGDTVVNHEDVLASYLVESFVVASTGIDASDLESIQVPATDVPVADVTACDEKTSDGDEANPSESQSR